MSLGVNQAYTQYYQIRLGTLSTKHQTQSNRVLLYTNQISDTATRINFYEQQKVLTLATPSGENLAIKAEYFDTPVGFDPQDSDTWGDNVYYTTPCQKTIYVFEKTTAADYATLSANERVEDDGNYYKKIPYTHEGSHTISTTSDYSASVINAGLQDSRVLSSKLMSGEYTFVYTNDDADLEAIRYQDLPFITEKEDATAYQEMTEMLEAERYNLQEMQKNVETEMQTTEVEIQAINSLLDSTEKILAKNTESFKWG